MAERASPHFGQTTGIARAAGAVFFGLAGTLLALVVLALAALQIAPLRHAALETALAEINRGETKIEIGDMEGRWPTSLLLHHLTASDAKGRWLSLDEVALEWRPTALLRGELHIVRLSVSGLDIVRAPESTVPSSDTGGFGLPTLPIIVAVDETTIDNLTLGKGLADPALSGRLARLDATARFYLTPSHVDLALAARRTDGTAGKIDARIFFDQRDKGLDLRVSGEDGAAGQAGLVASLAKLPGVDRMTLDATARNESGRVEAMARIGGGKALTLDASATGRWDTSLDLETKARAEGDLVARWLADLGRPRLVDAASSIRWGRDDRLTLDGLAIDAGMLALKGTTTIADASSATAHEVVAEGTLSGLDHLLGEPGNAALAPLGWRVAAVLDMAANTARIKEAVVTAKPGELRYTGEAALDGSAVKGDAEAEISDLAPVGALFGQRLAGRATIKLSPFLREAHGDLAGDFAIQASALGFGDDTLDRALGGDVAADGSLLLPKEGGFAVPALRVTPASGLYRFQGNIASGATDLLSGEAHFKAGEIAGLLPGAEVAGGFSVDATFGGTLDAPDVILKAELSDGMVAGFEARTVTLDVTAASRGTGPVALRFDGPDGKAALDAMLALPPEGGARLDALSADLFGTRLAGALTISDEGLVSGALKGERTQLAPLAGLAGLPIGGNGDIALTASASGGRQDAALTLDAPRLTVEAGEMTLERVALAVTARDVAGAAEIDGKLSAAAGQAGLTRLTSVSATAQGPLSALALAVGVAGTREGIKLQPVSLGAEALYAADADRLTVSRLRFAIADSSLALARPAVIGFGNGIAGKNLALDLAGPSGTGHAQGDLALAGRAARLHIETEGLPLELVTPLFMSQAAHGSAAGTLDLDSARGTGTLALRFDKVRLAEADERERPAFDATLEGRWAKGRLDLSARAEGVSTKPFDLKVSLPVVRDPKGAWPVPAARGAVSGRLTWEGPIASLFALTDVSNQQLSGDAGVALSASGDISAPRVSGTASVTHGVYENFDSGTVLRDLTLTLEGRENQSLHFTLDASDGAKGHVSAEGDIRLARGAFPAVSIGARFANARLVQTAEADIAVDGQLDLVGPALPPSESAPFTLKGALTTTLAQLRVPDRLPGSVAQIDVVEVNGPPSRHAVLRKSAPLPLVLDVAVKIGAPARVSGRGLDSLWTGDLAVTGTAEAPRVAGTLTSLRGTFDLAGKSFALTKGAVRFLDRTPIDPNLDMTLTYQRSDLTAAVNVTGRSSAPEIALTSTPDLPRDEIMSRILFDKGAGELSAMEAVQLANTLAQLSGKGGFSGAGILDSVQQALGLDVLQIGTAASGATTVAAGKYIEKGVYVGVEQGALASDSSVKVEIEVTPQISVDTRIGQNASGDVGVNWKWDY